MAALAVVVSISKNSEIGIVLPGVEVPSKPASLYVTDPLWLQQLIQHLTNVSCVLRGLLMVAGKTMAAQASATMPCCTSSQPPRHSQLVALQQQVFGGIRAVVSQVRSRAQFATTLVPALTSFVVQRCDVARCARKWRRASPRCPT